MEERRARRFLNLSGIDPADLKLRVGDPQLLVALLSFLEAHEPDLLAVAQEIGMAPATLVVAREALEKEG